MAVLEVGRICMKIAGREAGSYCAVIKPAGAAKEEKSFVFITGPKLLTGIKRRKCNIDHLRATEFKLEISEDASDEQIVEAYEKSGLIKTLNLKKPSAAQMKAKEDKEKRRAEAADKLKTVQKEPAKKKADKKAKKSAKKSGKK